jgi:hypothetical protein
MKETPHSCGLDLASLKECALLWFSAWVPTILARFYDVGAEACMRVVGVADVEVVDAFDREVRASTNDVSWLAAMPTIWIIGVTGRQPPWAAPTPTASSAAVLYEDHAFSRIVPGSLRSEGNLVVI